MAGEFLDVFPLDLLGLPLKWETRTGIDMILGTQFISIPLYQMAPNKLWELNV